MPAQLGVNFTIQSTFSVILFIKNVETLLEQ